MILCGSRLRSSAGKGTTQNVHIIATTRDWNKAVTLLINRRRNVTIGFVFRQNHVNRIAPSSTSARFVNLYRHRTYNKVYNFSSSRICLSNVLPYNPKRPLSSWIYVLPHCIFLNVCVWFASCPEWNTYLQNQIGSSKTWVVLNPPLINGSYNFCYPKSSLRSRNSINSFLVFSGLFF
jgi:hypothetical protein